MDLKNPGITMSPDTQCMGRPCNPAYQDLKGGLSPMARARAHQQTEAQPPPGRTEQQLTDAASCMRLQTQTSPTLRAPPNPGLQQRALRHSRGSTAGRNRVPRP